MKMPTESLYWHYLYNAMPPKQAESSYVAVEHLGKTYHLFNAARMPLGRMAERIATFVRGKHKPIYDKKRWD